MLIVCPSCASTYSLTPEQLGAGRRLRCAACRHEWFATPPEDAPAAAPGADAAAFDSISVEATSTSATPDAPDDPSAQAVEGQKARKRGRAKSRKPRVPLRERLAGVTGLLRRLSPLHAAAAALVLLVGVALIQRQAIVRALPQTAKLYAAVGLPVNLRGLAFQDVRSSLVRDGDQSILVVEGEIRGLAKAGVDLPRLQLSLRGADGHEIYAWTADAPRAVLQQGEVTPFRARLVAPPSDGQDVMVRFVERDARVAKP